MPLLYEVGDTVAIAQNYKRAGWEPTAVQYQEKRKNGKVVWRGDMEFQLTAGWTNKMFVLPDLMPWQIVIDDLWFERLQDITEQECICEGIKIKKGNRNGERPFGEFTFDGWDDYSFTAREAFAALIDRISGRGTWQRNPWVVAYQFLLQRAHGFPK